MQCLGVLWKCTLVAKGARCETLNDRFAGMWSYGRGPSAAKFDRLSAVKTTARSASLSPSYMREHTVQDDDLVRRVDVQALAERERLWAVVERRVRRRVVHGDRRVRQPRDELLDITDALHARDGRAEGGVVPEEQVETTKGVSDPTP